MNENNKISKQLPILVLDDLLQQSCKGVTSDNEFIAQIREYPIPPKWIEQHLRAAYAELDIMKMHKLVICIEQDSFLQSSNTENVTALFCEIMTDPRCDRLAEEIAEALNDCPLEKEALHSFAKACTMSIDNGRCWWDLRKALESMYGMYARKIITKGEIIAAFREILNHPNTMNEDCGLRDLASAYIEMI